MTGRGWARRLRRRISRLPDFGTAPGFFDVVSGQSVGKLYTLRRPKLYPIEIIYFILSA
jgi:hypothetical protein